MAAGMVGSPAGFALPLVIGQYRFCRGVVVTEEDDDVVLAVPALAGSGGQIHQVRCGDADVAVVFVKVALASTTTAKRQEQTIQFDSEMSPLVLIRAYQKGGSQSEASMASAVSRGALCDRGP